MPMGIQQTTIDLELLGVSQVDIARELGVSQPTVHRKVWGMREWTRSEINVVLAFARKIKPKVTYEELFRAA